MIKVLTGEVRHLLELLGPELRHLDGLLLHVVARGGHALLVGVVHDFGQVVRVQRVQNVEHVVPRRPFPFGELVREVRSKDRVVLERGEDALHTQLIVVRDLDRGYRSLLE